jgi:uncharacterized protein (DUF58 family)
LLAFLKNILVTSRVYIVLAIVFILFLIAFFVPEFSVVPRIVLLALAALILIDFLLLFIPNKPIQIDRQSPQRFSNGDINTINIAIQNKLSFPLQLKIIEELPSQFQKRDFLIKGKLLASQLQNFGYTLQPTQRGLYQFGNTYVLIASLLGFVTRRIVAHNSVEIPTYPSFKKMQRFALMAISNRLSEIGVKQIRKMGHSMEFEQIKEYVKGDDIRTINWKASSRHNQLMVNNYIDERSQQVYCIINKGRVMQLPFEGLTLLDHAINASLVLTNVALTKKDKAGLITFSNKANTFLPADAKSVQLIYVMETLYKEETTFLESDFEKLYGLIRGRITHRSLLVLFTNFETYGAFERELPFLKKIAANHLLMVVFFENTEIKKILEKDVSTIEEIYTQTIAEKFSYEKRKIVRELQQNGIITILTTPEQLTISTINKYVELKTRRAI